MSLTLAIAACAPAPTSSISEVPQRGASTISSLPAMKSFSARRGAPVFRSNAEIARDFLDLSFQMESGRRLPYLTRFDGPVKVSVSSGAPAGLERDLAQLLSRLRNEAGINISRARAGEAAQIIIEAIPRRDLQKAVPQAACFVVPNVSGWNEFKKNRNRGVTDWTKLTRRTRATVIIPSDVSPQEVRDCLHEEVAQALGPLNDLYRLPDSIFNDDNFHTVLTGFDMLILRAYYSPEMHNGITRDQAAAVLPSILSRLNPRGSSASARSASVTPQAWNRAIMASLAPRATPSRRASQAAEAVRIAKSMGWRDNRLAFSLFVQGRVTLGQKPQLAIESFVQSGALYKQLYGASVHAAHVATQMSAFALSSGQYDTAIKMANEAIPAARNGENAALLATLMMIKAQALEKTNQPAAANAVRVDALGWGRYGFGSDRNVRARLNEIKALTPRRG
ncbi:DUF2927 domain-containing protein [Litoreibacter sp.]|nr:DUF2927 domain-containing protein [Litoreibacter sp.]